MHGRGLLPPRSQCSQASVARGLEGKLQVRLANSTDYPNGCQYQVGL